MTYEEFVGVRLSAFLRYALMLTGDPHQAEDLVQETMVRAQLNWRRIRGSDSPDRYVRRMITNQYIDWRRGSWLKRVLLRAELDESSAIHGDHAQRAAERDQIWSLLARLPRRQRAALVLRFYEDLPDAEIAGVLDCPVGTVRSLISRALTTLRAQVMEVVQ
ncbi:SigE family RNA polymerase sigma factor [Micromonospora zhanjiangensis]|uniref:SigE family RNA polymerase sigma factor n=1 Tax=Micromonospora zhanjiangensis TaxID=1522057 RepID=A0ABV8KUT4_9ACTN